MGGLVTSLKVRGSRRLWTGARWVRGQTLSTCSWLAETRGASLYPGSWSLWASGQWRMRFNFLALPYKSSRCVFFSPFLIHGKFDRNEMCHFYFTPSLLPLLLAHLCYNCQTHFIIPFSCALRRPASQFPPGLTSQLTLEPCSEKWAIRYLCLPFLAPLPCWSPAYAGIKVPNKLHIMSSEECTCMFNGKER